MNEWMNRQPRKSENLLNFYLHTKRKKSKEENEWRKATLKKFGMVTTWMKKKRKTSRFMDAGSNNGNEREGNQQHGMDRQGRMKKENKTLGTERCKNIETLYIIIIIIIIITRHSASSRK